MKLLLASAIFFLFAGSVSAQERVHKVLLENDTIRVTETTYPPGSGTAQPIHPRYRITCVLKGGTLEQTHADGRKETTTYKTGAVLEQQPALAPYQVRNVGKTEVILYSVTLKAKK